MIYDVTRELLVEVLKEYVKIAKKEKGELVVFNENDEYDYIIEKIEDFEQVKTKKGDLVDATIYVNDDDILYTEFLIGTGKSYEDLKKGILRDSLFVFEVKEEKESQGKSHFDRYMKRK